MSTQGASSAARLFLYVILVSTDIFSWGWLIAVAKQVMTEWNETGPLRPAHVREAFRRISAEGNEKQSL